ncbi:hypothetical protein RvY_18546 [Ramazzottius varieornatus]|uniref:Uncharacterized protein n=1 Tax=Ramazzottius varieornatus TaxID=947166 RepID=A0A1D1W674_RAMVA|nr:hypothetical protein RvY_18546 [Ramazzottius varieornatus]
MSAAETRLAPDISGITSDCTVFTDSGAEAILPASLLSPTGCTRLSPSPNGTTNPGVPDRGKAAAALGNQKGLCDVEGVGNDYSLCQHATDLYGFVLESKSLKSRATMMEQATKEMSKEPQKNVLHMQPKRKKSSSSKLVNRIERYYVVKNNVKV